MLYIKGTYDGKEIIPLQSIPIKKKVNVLITLPDDDSPERNALAKAYESYYQSLKPEDSKEDTLLSEEFQSLDSETDQLLEDREI